MKELTYTVWTLTLFALASAQTKLLSDFTACCHHCRGDQDLWTEIQSNWTLKVRDEEALNFREPPAHLTDDEQTHTTTLYDRKYTLRYGGTPIKIQYDSLSSANTIKDQQYLQFDLLRNRDLAGVGMQGGFYEDVANRLVYRTETWVTHFLASYSTDGTNYKWATGAVKMLEANYDADTYVIVGFPNPILARYLRIHPTRGASKGGAVSDVLFRATPVTCVQSGSCESPRINCRTFTWAAWGECTCDWAGCTQTRMRDVARYSACGGAPCEHLDESQECTPEDPLWMSLIIYIGVGVAVLIIVLIIVIVVCIKLKKKKEEESPAFNRDESAMEDKKKKDKKKKDKKKKSDKEKIMEEEKGDLVEDLDGPVPIVPVAATITETDKTEKKKKKKKKNKVAEEPVKMAPVDEPEAPAVYTDPFGMKNPTDLGEEVDGMFMVTRDEGVAGALPPKAALAASDMAVNDDIAEIMGATEEKKKKKKKKKKKIAEAAGGADPFAPPAALGGLGGLPPVGGAPGFGKEPGLPPMGGGGGGGGGGKSGGGFGDFLDDWEDPPPYAP